MDDVWKVAKSLLGTVAPTIATALGGPLAGVATKAIIGALGLTDGTPADQVALAVQNATPEQLLALKKADQDFAVRMRELDIDVLKVDANDRDSARQRESSVRDWTPRILAFVVVAGFLTSVYMVLAGLVPGLKDPTTAALIGSLIGYVSAKADQVVAYYFGSNNSSERKTELLAKAGPIK